MHQERQIIDYQLLSMHQKSNKKEKIILSNNLTSFAAELVPILLMLN